MKRRQWIKLGLLSGATAMTPGIGHALETNGNLLDRMRAYKQDPRAIQLHADTLVVNGLDVSTVTEEYIELLKIAKINCWHKSMGGLDHFSDVHNFIDKHDEVIFAKSVQDIHQAYQNNQLALIAGWQSADVLGTRIVNMQYGPPSTSLRAYYELGLRIVGIAYNLTNIFGGGCLADDVPLSRAGKVLVEEIHKLNMLLDVGGHTGEQTSLNAIAISSGRPVICSHTNIASLANNYRNTSDRVIDAIVDTGGVIGLSALNDYHVRDSIRDLDKPFVKHVGVSALVDQMDYLKKRVGVNHIGIGPDFIHGRGIDYETTNQSLAIGREILSDKWMYLKDFENIAQAPNITREMIGRGWSTSEIKQVLGDNWLRVYKQAWGK